MTLVGSRNGTKTYDCYEERFFKTFYLARCTSPLRVRLGANLVKIGKLADSNARKSSEKGKKHKHTHNISCALSAWTEGATNGIGKF